MSLFIRYCLYLFTDITGQKLQSSDDHIVDDELGSNAGSEQDDEHWIEQHCSHSTSGVTSEAGTSATASVTGIAKSNASCSMVTLPNSSTTPGDADTAAVDVPATASAKS